MENMNTTNDFKQHYRLTECIDRQIPTSTRCQSFVRYTLYENDDLSASRTEAINSLLRLLNKFYADRPSERFVEELKEDAFLEIDDLHAENGDFCSWYVELITGPGDDDSSVIAESNFIAENAFTPDLAFPLTEQEQQMGIVLQ